MKSRKELRQPPMPFMAMVVIMLVLWIITGAGVFWLNNDWMTRGQFGDMFGAANALFSSLAFGVLIYSMWLQRLELELQREELRETKQELKRTADATTKQVQIAASSATLAALTQIAAIDSNGVRMHTWREVAQKVYGRPDANLNGEISALLQRLSKLVEAPTEATRA